MHQVSTLIRKEDMVINTLKIGELCGNYFKRINVCGKYTKFIIFTQKIDDYN